MTRELEPAQRPDLVNRQAVLDASALRVRSGRLPAFEQSAVPYRRSLKFDSVGGSRIDQEQALAVALESATDTGIVVVVDESSPVHRFMMIAGWVVDAHLPALDIQLDDYAAEEVVPEEVHSVAPDVAV
jgi:hypothetical protein